MNPADDAYLDHNAATPLDPRVREQLVADLTREWANPNSLHRHGRAARAVLEDAREDLAATLAVPARGIVFTSGGTEANNLALGSLAHHAPSGGGLWISAVEHPSVTEAAQAAARARPDLELVVLPVDGAGCLVLPTVAGPHPVAASLVLAQSETGTLQPVPELGHLMHQTGGWLHSDAAQALGRIPLAPACSVCDLLTLSPHKAGGPTGVGVLVVREPDLLHPMLVGGGQERGLRAGTEPVPLARAAALAIRLAINEGAERALRMAAARDAFEARLLSQPGIEALGRRATTRLPNTASMLFRGVDGRALLLALDARGISASIGSACASRSPLPSPALLAMGLSENEARATVRFSFDQHAAIGRAEEMAEQAGAAFSALRKASLAR